MTAGDIVSTVLASITRICSLIITAMQYIRKDKKKDENVSEIDNSKNDTRSIALYAEFVGLCFALSLASILVGILC